MKSADSCLRLTLLGALLSLSPLEAVPSMAQPVPISELAKQHSEEFEARIAQRAKALVNESRL
jgi:hypothetical protein